MKNFSFSVFIISAHVFGLLAFLSFITSVSFFEGTAGTGFFFEMSSKSFYIFTFPIINLLSLLGIKLVFPFVLTGIVIDCLLYGILIERIFSLFKKNANSHINNNKLND